MPVFTYPEILEWARDKAEHDPKYKRIFKAKRYVSIKKREKQQRSFCTKKQLRKCFACSTLVEHSDGTSFTVPSQAHFESWDVSQQVKIANNEKLDLFPFPPCPVEVFGQIGMNVGIEGFCSAGIPDNFTSRNDCKDYVFCSEAEIAEIQSKAVGSVDPLEPRPWLSWSDCFIKDCEAPAVDLHRFENCPFSEMTNDAGTLACIDED